MPTWDVRPLPKLPKDAEPAASQSYSDTASSESLSPETNAGTLPAAYVDTRPLSVAFGGDASGATIIVVAGATAPVEHGGNGLQANQDINIDAARYHLPKAMSRHPTEPEQPNDLGRLGLEPEGRNLEKLTEALAALLNSPTWSRTTDATTKAAPRAGQMRKDKNPHTSQKDNQPGRLGKTEIKSSARKYVAAAKKEWTICGIPHVYASVRRPGQTKASYIPSWQAQVKDGPGLVLGPRRYTLREAAHDAAELMQKKNNTKPAARRQEMPPILIQPASQTGNPFRATHDPCGASL